MVEVAFNAISPHRRCERCKRNFPAERSTARYCSDECRFKAWSSRPRGIPRTSASHDWYTPAEIVAAARGTMGGIDLDPASSAVANETIQAAQFYDEVTNGLEQPWSGRVWLNPPYGKLAPPFVSKFASHHSHDVPTACLLLGVHHMTTRWFAPLAEYRPVACMPSRRLRFSGSTREPAHGSVILGFGVDETIFRQEFASFGPIWNIG